MYILINLIRRPALKVTQHCVCQKNFHLQKKLLPQLRLNLSFCNKRHIMSGLSSLNKNPAAPALTLLHLKTNEVTTVSEQSMSSSSDPQQTTEVKDKQKTTEVKDKQQTEVKVLSNKDKLKRAVKDYGATVIIFHVTISLMSLGTSYLVISSGVDVASLLSKVGLDTQSNFTAGASTFVVAYAVHKMFAPVRISITLGATPFIVRYLRRVGILKPPKV